MASITNLFIDIGSDFKTDIAVTDDYGIPVDLTGYTVYAYFKRGYGSINLYTFNASIIAPEINGVVELSLPAADSVDLKPGRYLYDVLLTGGGYKNRIAEGIITFNPQVTITP